MATYHFSNKPHATLKSGIKMNVRTHYEYICREGKYAHIAGRSAEALVYTACGNMPAWAITKGETDARKFWAEDEKHRDVNARGYREIRIALMEEFTDQQNIELVETFLQRSGIKDKHAYSYAIHDKPAAFNSSHRNIHAHIMFNEKIIEHDRPLNADQYFKKYSTKKDGTAIGGYKVSRYFSSREATINMRQLWETIANDKFRELGRDERISCKSLKEQMAEAEERQDYLKADLLNRKSAPNIGSAYRNPATMRKINEMVREFSEAIKDPEKEPALEKKIELAQDDDKERSLILFAQDMALRLAAKEIEKKKEEEKENATRDKEEKLQEQAATEQAKEIEATPWAVTIADIMWHIEKEKEAAAQKTGLLYKEYNLAYVPDMTKEKAVLIAMNNLSNGKYELAKKELERLTKDYTENAGKEASLLKDTTPGAAERYSRFLKGQKLLKEKIEDKEKEINTIEEQLSTDGQKEKIRSIAERIWANNQETKARKIKILQEITDTQIHMRVLDEQLALLAKQNKYQAVTDITMDGAVTLKDKINGINPLRKLKSYTKDNKTYFAIEEKENTAKAVCLGDQVQDGTAPVYSLVLKKENERDTISSASKTEERIPLFQSHTGILEHISRIPGIKTFYQSRINRMEEAIREEYQRLFPADGGKQQAKDKNKEHMLRNKDPDIQL